MSGYVVRGKDEGDVWFERLPDGDWDTTKDRSAASLLPLGEALMAADEMRVVASDVHILAVADDGAETPMPTYEEALAEIRAADAALADLGMPDDGRPLAERIEILGATPAAAIRVRAMAAHAALWRAMNDTPENALAALRDEGYLHEAVHAIFGGPEGEEAVPSAWAAHVAAQDDRIAGQEAEIENLKARLRNVADGGSDAPREAAEAVRIAVLSLRAPDAAWSTAIDRVDDLGFEKGLLIAAREGLAAEREKGREERSGPTSLDAACKALSAAEDAFLRHAGYTPDPDMPGQWRDADGCAWPTAAAIQQARDRMPRAWETSHVLPEPAQLATGSQPIWPLVIADAEALGCSRLIPDMRARDAFGREKYGTPLTADNGRNHLADAYQEALDEVVYLRAAMEQGADVGLLYAEALRHALRIRDAIDGREDPTDKAAREVGEMSDEEFAANVARFKKP